MNFKQAIQMANNMQKYSVEHIVCGSELIFNCDLSLTMEYLTHLTPENCIIMVSRKDFNGQTSLKEKWYGTDYNKKDFEEFQLKLWKQSLSESADWDSLVAMPTPNLFIPTDFALKESDPNFIGYS